MTTHAPERPTVSRRAALALGGAGLSAILLGQAHAATTDLGGRKLVVIICRGAMDGLSVCPPIGDADYANLRGAIAIPGDQALKLDDTFSLHPSLSGLHGMVQSGQARIAPAVAIPQRIRSHFEAQDMLESGGDQLYGVATGWLNRTLQAVQPSPIKAISIGPQQPLILHGPVEAESWSPGGRSNSQSERVTAAVQALYQDDYLLGPALATGLEVQNQAMAQGMTMSGGGAQSGGDAKALALTTAKFMTQPGGPSIAVLSLGGFDTHAGQGAVSGRLANRLAVLDGTLTGLQAGLGEQWGKTVVIVATEFGRTAHVNGTNGTDHGTASTLILAGGALKRGGIIGDWPTLQAKRLFENRDLAPTLDIRQVFKGVLADHMGVSRAALDHNVFPGSVAVKPIYGLA
jgi:uncharacterized protein (DUF1501 family)